MSKHTPLTEAERKSLLVYLDQYDTDEDVNETELFAVVNDMLAARTSTATADTGLRERVEALARNEQAAMDLWWKTTGDDWAVPDHLPRRFLRTVLEALDATAAPTTDTGARDE